MNSLFMPWLCGWWPRLRHVLRGHRLSDASYEGEGTTRVHCSCGATWLEDDRL